MTHTDLIKRLSRADEYDPVGHDAWEAADALAALEVENRRLREALQRAYDHVLRDAPDWFMRHSHEQQALEVERSAALSALRSTEASHDQ